MRKPLTLRGALAASSREASLCTRAPHLAHLVNNPWEGQGRSLPVQQARYIKTQRCGDGVVCVAVAQLTALWVVGEFRAEAHSNLTFAG